MFSLEAQLSKSEKIAEKSPILAQHLVIAPYQLSTFIDKHKKEAHNFHCNAHEKWSLRKWHTTNDQHHIDEITDKEDVVGE